MTGILSSLRFLFADIIGVDDDARPDLPDGLPEAAIPVVQDGIDVLVDYQGPSYAQLYVDRVKRFIPRPQVDAPMLCEIARLLTSRMAYEDPIRLAQLKLNELEARVAARDRAAVEVWRFRFDELIGALPGAAGDPLLTVCEKVRWLHRHVPVRFATRKGTAVRRLTALAGLRRWRRQSVRYAEERIWVERWLHMIARSLDKQPAAAGAVIATATMIAGHGDPYRQGLADWHAIIDGLVKPTFDGALPLTDLAGAIAEARAAAMPDPRQAALKRAIAQIRARAYAEQPTVHAAE